MYPSLHFFPIKLLLKLLCTFASRKFHGYIFHLYFRISSEVGKLALFFCMILNHRSLLNHGELPVWPLLLPSQPLIVLVFPSTVFREAVSNHWEMSKSKLEKSLSRSPLLLFPFTGVWLQSVDPFWLTNLQSPGDLRIFFF